MFLKKTALIMFSVGSLGLTACSGESWVKDISVGTQEINAEEYVSVSAQINTRALQMASITIPIYDPQSPTTLIGQLSLAGGFGTGTSTLSALIKSSALIDIPVSGGSSLPNGTLIPVSGVDAKKWKVIPIGNGQSKIYFNLDATKSKAVFGTSLNIDALTTGVTATALLPFTVKNISGLAGIYTGASSGQSGFALFADVSQLLQNSTGATGISFLQRAKASDASKIQQRVLDLEQKRTLLKAR